MLFGSAPKRQRNLVCCGFVALLTGLSYDVSRAQGPVSTPAFGSTDAQRVLDKYCVGCHNQKARTANLALDGLDVSTPAAHPVGWEKVVQKLRVGTMPPAGAPKPDPATYAALAGWLEGELDKAWMAKPNPGRIQAVHRLNRQEYKNAVRDLLALDVDIAAMLPPDSTADGSFDNMANVLTISPAHLDRYLSAARHISRLAVGLPPTAVISGEFGLPRDHLQEDMVSTDLPLGTRGGIAARYTFPVDGEYRIRVILHRSYQDYILGMGWQQPLDVRLNNKLLKRFVVGGGALPYRGTALGYAGDGEPGSEGAPEWESYLLTGGDADLEARTFVKAGPRVVAAAFPRDLFEPDGLGNPAYGATGEYLLSEQYMAPARIAELRISGPYPSGGVAGSPSDTPSRRRIFTCVAAVGKERTCASEILGRLARHAYRRRVTEQDLDPLLQFFESGRKESRSFDGGIQLAIERLLVDPDFLLRVYRDPAPDTTGVLPTQHSPETYRLSDLELASRLSFFLWSSIPDEPLLKLAESGELSKPQTLRLQVRRMLVDPRAPGALVRGFVAQWLNLRRLEEYTPDYEKQEGLRVAGRALLQAFSKETELFAESMIGEDRPMVELLNANYTYLNEALARHYGIPNVYGSHFRRVTLPDTRQRGGLLGQAGILTLTSYPDRTSPVLRGKWLLDNILDAPVPPPPDDVDTTLKEESAGTKPKSVRERLEQHRTQARCSSCHSVLDPLGFALDGYDAVGRTRTKDEAGNVIDDSGNWPGGVKLNGLAGIRNLVVGRPEELARTVTRKLMSYALGRELEYYDQPAVRAIVRGAAADQYRWSSIVRGIVETPAFQMRARRGAPDVAQRR
jgi:mono/diheme cytochrome c family protein